MRLRLLPFLLLAGLIVPAAPAGAVVAPSTVLAGPSGSILGVGNVAMAPDGTGGVVWRQLVGGVAHIFAAQFRDGSWSAPLEVDAGQSGPASDPAIAAGDGGELLVVWVQPWASVSSDGTKAATGAPPTTLYQLMSAVLEPSADGFGPAEEVDPNNVGSVPSGVTPALAMAPDGNAYVAYRVVTNTLNPDQEQPGEPTPLRPGDELVDVRVARFNGLFWSSLGAVNAFPGVVTMRQPSASNAPVLAIDRRGDAIVVWQEPTVDGTARIWARRLFGTAQGFLLEASPQSWNGRPVSTDADAPSVSMNDYGGVKVAFRVGGAPGSAITSPTIFVNTLTDAFVPSSGGFSGPQAIGSGATVGPPSVALDDDGDFTAGFSDAGQVLEVSGQSTAVGPARPLGSANGAPALATLDPDGGGALIWPGADAGGRAVAQVRDVFPDGGYQTAQLTAPISGPVSDLSLGPSGGGDALLAWQQGLSSTSQVVVSDVEVPPHSFFAFAPIGWVKPRHILITWDPAQNAIGAVRYDVLVDGRVKARNLRALSWSPAPGAIGDGTHDVRVVAVDGADEDTFTPVALLQVDGDPPLVHVRHAGPAAIEVTVRDPDSGLKVAATVIDFGDGTRPVARRGSALHRYARSGRYLITVRCADHVGNTAVDHIWVDIR